MIDKSIRNKREQLRKKSIALQELYLDEENYSKFNYLIKEQDELHKKWKFYDNLIKSIERVDN